MFLSFTLCLFASTFFQDKTLGVYGDSEFLSGKCKCGRMAAVSTRIVSGWNTGELEHPSLAMILKKGRLHCGATVINSFYVMTAAHCVKVREKIHSYTVVLGAHNRLDLDRWQQSSYKIAKRKIHPRFGKSPRGGGTENDIALLMLDREIVFSEYVQPICLPTIDTSAFHQVRVQGWGLNQFEGYPSVVPKEAALTLISAEECQKSPSRRIFGKPGTHLCAIDKRSDACRGDSGGPMFVTLPGGIMTQIGIVSEGISCAKPGFPGIYTRVEAFLDWIHRHTTEGVYCGL